MSQPKRTIVFDANPLVGSPTGVGYLTQSLVEALAKREDVELVGHYFNFLGRKDDTHLLRHPNIQFKRSILFPTKLVSLLRRIGIELPFELFTRTRADVHMFSNFTSLPSLFRTPSVLFVHDVSFIDLPQYVSEANRRYLERYVPKSIKRAAHIYTISAFSKQRITEIYSPASTVSVIPVPPEITTSAGTLPDVKKTYSIPDNYLLFVGTIEPRKNIAALLDAYEQIHAETGVALVLVGGKGWKDEETLTKLHNMQNRGLPIIQTGYVSQEEKTALYAGATLYVQPSFYEGFGMPILEAMQHGLPVLCSDIPVFREVAGDNAVFFKTKSATDLSAKATQILEDKQQLASMRRASQKHAGNYPLWDDVAEQFITKM